jgi:hypothetical protein
MGTAEIQILGISLTDLAALLAIIGGIVVGYIKYVHRHIQKYWRRLKIPSEKEKFEDLLRFVPALHRNLWHTMEKDGIIYLNLGGELQVTNVSESARVVLSKSGVAGFDSVGEHLVPHSENNVHDPGNPIEKRSSIRLSFNYQIKGFRKKTKPKMLFNLFFYDQFGNRYDIKRVEFFELGKS